MQVVVSVVGNATQISEIIDFSRCKQPRIVIEHCLGYGVVNPHLPNEIRKCFEEGPPVAVATSSGVVNQEPS